MSKGPQTSITRPGFSCVFRSVIWMTIHCYTCAPPTAWSQLPTSSCHIAVAVVTILPMCHTCVTSQTAKVTLPSTQLPVGVLVEWQGPFWTRELTQTSNHTQGENTSLVAYYFIQNFNMCHLKSNLVIPAGNPPPTLPPPTKISTSSGPFFKALP